MSNTMLSPLEPDGGAASWPVVIQSDSARNSVSIDADNGYPSCSAKPGGAGRAHDVRPDFFQDGGAPFAIAKQHADALRVQRYGVMIGTAATPNTLHATWDIDDHKSGANDGSLPVPANAGTGKVEIVLK